MHTQSSIFVVVALFAVNLARADGTVPIPVVTHPTALVTDAYTGCVTDVGALKCWGFKDSVDQVPGDLGAIRALPSGSEIDCAITEKGARCWGGSSNFAPFVARLKNPKMIAPRDGVSGCALDDSGVTCWMDRTISGGTLESRVIPLKNPREIVGMNDNFCAIDDGGAECWTQWDTSAKWVASAGAKHPHGLQAGEAHFCLIDDDGIKCWGKNGSGQAEPPALKNARELALGYDHSCALLDQRIQCWGGNQYGQTSVPISVKNPRLIAASGTHTCAVDDDGVKCWGGGYSDLNAPSVDARPDLVTPIRNSFMPYLPALESQLKIAQSLAAVQLPPGALIDQNKCEDLGKTVQNAAPYSPFYLQAINQTLVGFSMYSLTDGQNRLLSGPGVTSLGTPYAMVLETSGDGSAATNVYIDAKNQIVRYESQGPEGWLTVSALDPAGNLYYRSTGDIAATADASTPPYQWDNVAFTPAAALAGGILGARRTSFAYQGESTSHSELVATRATATTWDRRTLLANFPPMSQNSPGYTGIYRYKSTTPDGLDDIYTQPNGYVELHIFSDGDAEKCASFVLDDDLGLSTISNDRPGSPNCSIPAVW